jgi:hypothetical protein
MSYIDAQYAAISEHTVGLIFFGTPHRGSDKATYGKSFIKHRHDVDELSTIEAYCGLATQQ